MKSLPASRFLVLCGLIAVSVACRSGRRSSASGAFHPRREVVSLARISCYGWCPEYSVRLYDDGLLAYEGKHFVRTIGHAELRVRAQTLDAVRRLVTSSDLDSLKPGCCDCYEVTDQPAVSIGYDSGDGQHHVVEHYAGCSQAPAWLGPLEEEIDRILETDRLIGTKDERDRQFGRGRAAGARSGLGFAAAK